MCLRAIGWYDAPGDHTQVISARDLHKTYNLGPDNIVRALAGVSIDIDAGELCVVLGRSGSGKSTLMNLLGGLDRPDRGTLSFEGRDLASMSQRQLADFRASTVGFVFQAFHLQSRMQAWENVALPLVFTGASRADRKRRAMHLLERVGLEQRASHRPTELSGGEQQRVALARALITAPRLLLGDEPTGNLDTRTSSQIMELIQEANDGGTTVVIVSHDQELAERYARRIVRMEDGKVIEDRVGVRA